MTLKHIASFLIITLLLAACSAPTSAPSDQTGNPTLPPAQTSPTNQPSAPSAYPAPNSSVAPSTSAYPAPYSSVLPTYSPYPEPGNPGTGTSLIPPSGYEPQPGDDSLKRDQVFLDVSNSQPVVTASEPAQANAVLTGNLPDPCHLLRVIVTPPDASKTINIEVYSLVDPNTGCVTKLEPFTASIPLGSYSSGQYTVVANGDKLGQFPTSFAPQPGDEQLTRSEVIIDRSASKLVKSGTQPNQVSVNLKGDLPTPCTQLRIVLTPAATQNKINLEVYSVYDSKANCITVIQPYQIIYPLGSFSSGHYSIYVNGELLGEFDV